MVDDHETIPLLLPRRISLGENRFVGKIHQDVKFLARYPPLGQDIDQPVLDCQHGACETTRPPLLDLQQPI